MVVPISARSCMASQATDVMIPFSRDRRGKLLLPGVLGVAFSCDTNRGAIFDTIHCSGVNCCSSQRTEYIPLGLGPAKTETPTAKPSAEPQESPKAGPRNIATSPNRRLNCSWQSRIELFLLSCSPSSVHCTYSTHLSPAQNLLFPSRPGSILTSPRYGFSIRSSTQIRRAYTYFIHRTGKPEGHNTTTRSLQNERREPTPSHAPQACRSAGRAGSRVAAEAGSGPEHAYVVVVGSSTGYQQGVGEQEEGWEEVR